MGEDQIKYKQLARALLGIVIGIRDLAANEIGDLHSMANLASCAAILATEALELDGCSVTQATLLKEEGKALLNGEFEQD